jgi:non-canonical purine NTP pyrophosphatase (RdgB/HAM1 family)
MEILIATKNKAKIKKYSTILNELGIKWITINDLGKDIYVEENGNTPKENSIIKAKAYYEAFKIPVLADDSGLILDKLPASKQPGVFVRRHNGKELTDEQIIELYSNEIEKVGGETTGGFLIAISIINENGEINTNEIMHDRLFVSKPCKERTIGYPMNSLIYDKETGKYLAQNYEGKAIYKGNSFGKDFEFIKSVLGGNNEK